MAAFRTVTISRPDKSTPWGFRLSSWTGMPIIAKVRPGSIASHFVQEGEPLLKIGNVSLTGRSMDDVMEILMRAGNILELTLDTNIINNPNTKLLSRSHTQPESEISGPIDFTQSELVRMIQQEEKGFKGRHSGDSGVDERRCGYGPDGDPIVVEQRNVSQAHKISKFKEPRWRTTDSQSMSNSSHQMKSEFQNPRMHRSQEWEPNPVDYEEDGDPERKSCFKGDTIPSKTFKILQNMVQEGLTSNHGGHPQANRRQRAIYKWTPVDHDPAYNPSPKFNLKKTGSLNTAQGVYRSPQMSRAQVTRAQTDVSSSFGEVTDCYTDF